MNPAQAIIEKLGGDRAVCDLLLSMGDDCCISTVCRWRLPKERGGTGGLIPSKRIMRLIAAAQEKGVILTPADFFTPNK